jgi:3D (Asp-Asp-Asp) domain-containing protein
LWVLWPALATACVPLRQPPPRLAFASPSPRRITLPPPGEHPLLTALRFDLPAPHLATSTRLDLWATYYYVPRVYFDPRGFAMRDAKGAALGPRLSRRDWCEAAMQGTVLVTMPDGRPLLVNYAGTKPNIEVDCTPIYPKHKAIGRSRYSLTSAPYGNAAVGNLIPFRTIAVDPKTIPLRSLIYIPAARGTPLQLPSGQQAWHDGYFYAADVGGAIKKKHIDVFVGARRHNPFRFVTSTAKKGFVAYIVPPPSQAQERLERGHRR